jgi:uncharacterized protein YoxC
MDNHSDRTALGAGAANRRRGRIIAKIIGTLALVSFMLVATASTARALGIGEIVDESPLGPVTETVENVTEPVTNAVEPVTELVEEVTQPVTEAVEPAVEPVEEVTEPVTKAVEPVTEPVAEITRTVTKAVAPVTEPVADITETVAGTIEQPVNRAVEAVEPVTDAVTDVVGSVTETLEGPVTGVAGTVGNVIDEVRGPIEPVLEVIDETLEGTTGVIGGITTPILEEVDDLVDPVLPLIPGLDDPIDVGDDPEEGASISDPNPVRGPDFPDTPSNPPGSRTDVPDERLAQPVLVPVPSFLTTPLPAGGAGQASEAGGAARESPPTRTFMADTVRGGDSSGGAGPPDGTGYWPHSLALPAATGSSSGSGPALGLLAVLVLLGLIAPRLSRWLRPRPVIWRPYALAEALELPG